MKTFQRYALWIIGWGLIVFGIYEILHLIYLVVGPKDIYRGQEGFDLLWLLLSQFFGSTFQTFGMAFICLFLARICKLEDDPKFKDHLNQLVKTARNAGSKT